MKRTLGKITIGCTIFLTLMYDYKKDGENIGPSEWL